MWFEPTSIAKSTKILQAIRANFGASAIPPITYISPNILELKQLFSSSREAAIQNGRELPALTSLDAWFAGIDNLGLQSGTSSDAFARLGGNEGSFLAKDGIIQMSVQLLPFFQHLIVKCGDKGEPFDLLSEVSR